MSNSASIRHVLSDIRIVSLPSQRVFHALRTICFERTFRPIINLDQFPKDRGVNDEELCRAVLNVEMINCLLRRDSNACGNVLQ